ncbi:MAG: DsbC family protein [Smithellaceae bacterium]
MRKLLALLALMMFVFPACSSAQKLSPEEQFKKSYPKHAYESFTSTSIKGLYEVYNGRQIYYYLPDSDVVFYGSVVTKDGVNLTRESHMKKMALKMESLPLEKALKVGHGKTIVVKFTDPNCPYCRRGFEFFDRLKDDVTTYVFFLPLSADSERKIQHILCAKDRVVAYEDVFRGKFDQKAPLDLCDSPEVLDTMKMHRELAVSLGVRATPLFYIKGQIVDGFDPPVIEKLFKE